MKYVICVPDGCADLPVPELGGKTPLEVAGMPNLDALAARSTLGRAEVIPSGICLLYTSPSPRDRTRSRMPSSA